MEWLEREVIKQANFDVQHSLGHLMSDSQRYIFDKTIARLSEIGELYQSHFNVVKIN